ncbi:hypothetical protein [Bacteroides thetaiotaomicron]|uniref:hypothetical protein n=1 Tax=Bacteroides thetaiotaomicron TaxID=818 RepID=UPI0035660580
MKRNLLIITLLFLGSFVILLLGNIIIIGEKIASLSHVAWAEYAFYTLLLVVFYVVVIRPVVRVHRAPQIPALSIDGEWNTAQLVAFGHKLADNCNYIPKDKSCPELRKLHQQRLREDLERYATSKEELVQIISKELKLRIEGGELKETSGPRIEDMYSVRIIGINRRIIEWAKSVFMITAISQNGKLDTVSVLYMNYKMIEDVIVASGFRPTRQQLFRQYVNILVTSLMTFVVSEVFKDMSSVAPFGSLADQSSDAASDIDISDASVDTADVDLDDIGDTVSGDTGFLSILSNVKIPGVVIGSICDGIVNSLMTLRIGYVTRNYLIDGMNSLNGIKAKRKAKRAAVKEALKSLPKVVVVGTSFVGKGAMNIILNIIGGKKVKETDKT